MSESGELIPYSVTFEGKIDPSKLPELLAVLGEISTEQHVSYQIGEDVTQEAEDQIYKNEMSRHWNHIGASQAWGRLVQAAQELEGFPLRYVEAEDAEADYPYLQGDLSKTVDWLLKKPLKGSGSQVAITVLNRIMAGTEREQ